MSIESAADRATFVDTDDFAVAATYTPAGGAAATVNGNFDSAYADVELGGAGAVEGEQLRFVCRTADVSSARHGDTLAISGTTYIVRGVRPDGTGMTTLWLEEQ